MPSFIAQFDALYVTFHILVYLVFTIVGQQDVHEATSNTQDTASSSRDALATRTAVHLSMSVRSCTQCH